MMTSISWFFAATSDRARYPSLDSHYYGFDSNGNLISDAQDNGNSSEYAWDFENRVVQAYRSSPTALDIPTWQNTTGVTVNYKYDALGRRIQRTSQPDGWEDVFLTNFTYDGQDVVRDLDASGNVIAEYLNGPGIDNKLRQTNSATGAM